MAAPANRLVASMTPDLLREDFRVARRGHATLVITDDEIEIEIEHARITPQFVDALIECRSVGAAARRVMLDEEATECVRHALVTHGALNDPRLRLREIPSEAAEIFILNLLNRWVDEIYYDGLWDPLLMQSDMRNLLYGWAVENYHYTRSVDEHLATAVRRARDPVVGARFAHHLSQEWDHPHLFLKSARSIASLCGSTEDPSQSSPLGATRAVTLHLKRAAQIHPFVYKTCAAVLERTAALIEETRQFYRAASEAQGLPFSAVEDIVLHAETDGEYGHMNSLAELRKVYPTLPPEIVNMAAEFGRTFVDLLHLWQRAIVQRYGGFRPGMGASGTVGGCGGPWLGVMCLAHVAGPREKSLMAMNPVESKPLDRA
jgi:hypothetical protein